MVERNIKRVYKISQGDVHEAVNAWLRNRGLPVPGYIGDTPTTKWTGVAKEGVTVEWTEEDSVEAIGANVAG